MLADPTGSAGIAALEWMPVKVPTLFLDPIIESHFESLSAALFRALWVQTTNEDFIVENYHLYLTKS